MRKHILVILTTVTIFCIAAQNSGGTEHSAFPKPILRLHDRRRNACRPPTSRLEANFDLQILKQQSKIEKLRRQLMVREQALDRLLVTAHDSDKAHKVAVVLNTTSAEGYINCGTSDGFREGDRVVFVRRTADGIIVTAQGIIDRTYATDAEFFFLGTAAMQPEDEVYISNRGDSIFSLALLRF